MAEMDPTPRSEKAKMLAGELYDCKDPELSRARHHAQECCQRLNRVSVDGDPRERRKLLEALFGQPTDVEITPPFHCDYGSNIRLGQQVYMNVNCVILDVVEVVIGDRVLLGPGVQIYAATHPLDLETRRSGLEFGKPVSIGDDAWIGGGAIICPGVSIGRGAVIGAGSVVTRDIPERVLAVGNPCRVIRPI